MTRALLLLFFAARSLAAQNTGPEIIVEAKVFGIPRADLARLYPEGTAKPLTAEAAQTLDNAPNARLVHRLELRTTPGKETQLRIDTRIPAPAEDTSHYEIGLALELTPQVFPNREVVLATTSRVQIRRADGADLSSLFEAQSVRRSPKIPEGQSVLLAGFLTSTEANRLPTILTAQENPILRYLYSTKLQPKDTGEDEYEIVVLLKPRVEGTIAPGLLTEKDPALFTIQVGAFAKSSNAERLVEQLRKNFEDVYMDKPVGSTLYRVRIGRLPNRTSAGQVLRKLFAQGFDPFVTAMN